MDFISAAPLEPSLSPRQFARQQARRMPNAGRSTAGANRLHAAQRLVHRQKPTIDLDGRANEIRESVNLMLATSRARLPLRPAQDASGRTPRTRRARGTHMSFSRFTSNAAYDPLLATNLAPWRSFAASRWFSLGVANEVSNEPRERRSLFAASAAGCSRLAARCQRVHLAAAFPNSSERCWAARRRGRFELDASSWPPRPAGRVGGVGADDPKDEGTEVAPPVSPLICPPEL